MSSLKRLSFLFLALLVIAIPSRGTEVEPVDRLGSQLRPWLDAWNLKSESLQWSGDFNLLIDGKKQSVKFRLIRQDQQTFQLELVHADYEVTIVRNQTHTAFVLPKHKRLFLGNGAVDALDHLQPTDLFQRLVSDGSMVHLAKGILKSNDASDVAGAVIFLTKLQQATDLGNAVWKLPDGTTISLEAQEVKIRTGDVDGVLQMHSSADSSASIATGEQIARQWKDFEVVSIDRAELERSLARGVRRALEVFAPSPKLTSPKMKDKSVEHGRLVWREGQRLALLWGTPDEIGEAHGKLLGKEAQRCIDSVVYAFGAIQTIQNGRWFRQDLEKAYERLAPHIPERHKSETRALAISMGVEPALMQVVNVFPELFHCSGFAVFGSATKDGKLYHGRVLDYMTAIGLQDAATTFIVSPTGYQSFANVGYGGFIGSVSGMNGAQISLGEMGGKGEGKWDGVPMATLMRRALEECTTLDEVKKLWADSPRTCEYYYVFADGKDRSAVGVSATPEEIQFVAPGEAHPLLGEGIRDAVVLSAGTRLDALKQRIRDSHGMIDATVGQQLMCRPVAMTSNLHNVLFVPEDGILYVANADHQKPAADRPYAKIDLKEYLNQIRQLQSESSKTVTQVDRKKSSDASNGNLVGQTWTSKDSLAGILGTEDENTKIALERLLWKASSFDVNMESKDGRNYVRFPSPVKSNIASNDLVALDWYNAKGNSDSSGKRPAVLVVHESGRAMTVGKMIATGIANQGIHAFLIHLPHYGVRRSDASQEMDPALSLRQSIADVRRAYDAISVLPGIDTSRICLQGTSLGGFVAATTAGMEDRFHRVVILLAGGDLVSVITEGKKDAQGFRKQMESRGLDEAAIRASLQIVEPMNFAHRINPDRVWLYSGKYDDVVPPRNSKLFADAAKLNGHHIELEADHYSGVLMLPSVLRDLARIVRE
jgi:dienelactone hydrolase